MEPEDPFSDRPPPEPVVPPWRMPRPKPQVFGVPRRYDLATLMAVTLAYACLFGALRALDAPPEAMIWIAGLLTVIGAAQALLFGGKCPREASYLTGAGFMLAVMVIGWGVEALARAFLDRAISMVFLVSAYAIFGALLGYAGGGLVAGVFLVAHHLRSGLRRFRGRRRAAPDESHPEP